MLPCVGDSTERELIARIQHYLPPSPQWMLVGIGDDAAVVEPERNRLEVLTVDAAVEGVHFNRSFTPPEAIGHRAMAANLSDLAAMGSTPRLALLSLALPVTLPIADFERMLQGLVALSIRHRLHIAGGNLTRSPGPLAIHITLVGTVKPRRALTRGGARPGDELYVTGTIGGAAAGLDMLTQGVAGLAMRADGVTGVASAAPVDTCVNRYLYPEPRVRMGQLLAWNRAASACMDLSDGLADAVRQVAEASGVGAIVEADALPIDPHARRWFDDHGQDAVAAAMSGGDDYELLVAVRPRTRSRLEAARRHGTVPLTRIGFCTKGSGVVLRAAGREAPVPAGYSHFR